MYVRLIVIQGIGVFFLFSFILLSDVCITSNDRVLSLLAHSVTAAQGSITEIVSSLFGIKHDYAGSIMSNFAKLNMTSVVEDVNDGHMDPWMEMTKAAGIENTPLSPYLDKVRPCCWYCRCRPCLITSY